jgi:hypothetical protein
MHSARPKSQSNYGPQVCSSNMAMSPTSVCASILNDLIDSLILETATEAIATDATACDPAGLKDKDDDIVGVCSSWLSDLVSKVALEGGVELAEKITLESDVLDWLSGYRATSPRPSVEEAEEKLKHASKLVTKKPFAQKVYALEASGELLMTLTNRGSENAVLCIRNVLDRVPGFKAKLLRVRDVYRPMLRMAVGSKFKKASNQVLGALVWDEEHGLDPTEISKLAASEEVVAWMALLFEMGGNPTDAMKAIFKMLDDAKKIQVCSVRCCYCALVRHSHHALTCVYRCT